MSRGVFSLASVLISLAAQADSPLTDVAMGGEHWAYFDSKGHAYNLFWNAGNFGMEDATDLSGAPPAAPGSSLTSFADPLYLLFGQHWSYFDKNGHAYNISWNFGSYGMDDLTALSGAPPAAPGSPLTGFADPTFTEQHWTYFDNNGHAYHIHTTLGDRLYAVEDATALSGAPPAAPGSPLTSFADSALPGQHWAYFDNNGHAYHIFWTPGEGYGMEDVTALSGAPPAAPGSPLTSFSDPTFPPGQHWAYFDSNGHAYNIHATVVVHQYAVDDATALSGAPPAASGSPLISFASSALPGQHWAYFDNNGHAYNIFWTPMGGYGMDDATAGSGAPPAAPGSPLAGFAHSWFLLEHWAYFGNNGHAYDIMWTRTGGYAVDDATARSGAPAAAPGSSLAGFVDPDGPPQ